MSLEVLLLVGANTVLLAGVNTVGASIVAVVAAVKERRTRKRLFPLLLL